MAVLEQEHHHHNERNNLYERNNDGHGRHAGSGKKVFHRNYLSTLTAETRKTINRA